MMRGDRDGRGGARLRACLNAAFGIVLCLLALPALALGLGQIEVKSRPGQPLLAEIPIVTSDPTELQGLTARLAPPETFRRVGLDPPQGIVSGLSFEPALNAAGRPVIRVTSAAPVDQPALTFLLEVDWGQGRLVREYVAQVQTPDSLPAQVVAPVQAPVPAPDGLIERPAAPVSTETTTPDTAETAVATEPANEAAPPPETAAAPQATEPAPTVASQPEPGPVPEPAPEPAADAGYAVQRGDTLSQVARDLAGLDGYTLDQAMLALLQANPEAFIDENINRLRAGAVLRMPAQETLSRYSSAQAAGIVREQVASWRASQRAQASVTATGATAATVAGGAGAAAGPQVADARLEIAPPRASGGERAGTQSGASAGGEGDMLRQELQETKETLAARDAELAELKTRVAELEQLQQQQQDLIAMKDDALASAQQRLAQVDAGPPDTGATTPPPGASAWWWALPLALLLGGLAWWMLRRRRQPVVAAAGRARVSDAFAAPATGAEDDVRAEPGDAEGPDDPAPVAPQWVGRHQAATAPASAPATPPADGEPTWVAATSPGAESIAPLNQAPAGRDRIELARAYVELGDRATARTLLQEVVDGGDPRAREEARRALQLLG